MPCDAALVAGECVVNESSLTGEASPEPFPRCLAQPGALSLPSDALPLVVAFAEFFFRVTVVAPALVSQMPLNTLCLSFPTCKMWLLR